MGSNYTTGGVTVNVDNIKIVANNSEYETNKDKQEIIEPISAVDEILAESNTLKDNADQLLK
jgi:hypothetical protein